MDATYLVFTNTYGILRKADDSIKSARKWAARALPAGNGSNILCRARR